MPPTTAKRAACLIGGKTIEATVWGQKTAEAKATLEADHIKPVSSTLYLDVDQLLTQLNPTNAFYDHDKVEGVAALEGGKRIVISNDNDFGISGAEAAPAGSPYKWKLKPEDPALHRQAGRRRVPRNQHVRATGADEHRDGHDQRERSALSPAGSLT